MGWRAKAGREQRVLGSIVSHLVSLADLAESAASRSPWVRWCVLWAAWQAHAILMVCVEGSSRTTALRHWSPAMMPVGFGADPADAQDLAASLRAVAVVVRAMAAHVRRLSFLQRGQASDEAGNDGGPGPADGGPLHARPEGLADAARSPVELRDTS